MTVEERAAAASAIAVAVTAELDRLTTGAVVALYAEKGSEVTTDAIDAAARERGLVVVYPRVTDGERVLSFAAVERNALVTAKYGLLEPRAGEPVIALSEIAMFVVPGVAFDRDGHRIGWGRGHYDATLAIAPQARRIALAFECQIVESVEHEAHDAPMHAIITEVATHVV
jgi:5-formyltetrahydrofolate cyclo-ligase